MIAIKTTDKGLEIDFNSTMFMHEMFLLKNSEDKILLQRFVEARDNESIFKLIVDRLGIDIFYFI